MSLTKKQIRQILFDRTKNWSFKTLSSLPHPYTLKDCEQASLAVVKAINERKKILIVGDYDVDGIISSVVMMRFFEMIDYHNVSYVIPNRFEDGYGLSEDIIKRNPSDIIITVDNGITAFEAALFCKEQNIPLIITDHHLPKENLPEATFIINPQRKDCNFAQKEICGAMVAWYFCAGIKIALNSKINITYLLELVMLATIADMMPLTQINKTIVLYGLKRFKTSGLIPIQKLKTQLKTKNPTAIDISFSLTPLLNSAGRMGEGRIASEFLLAKDHQTSNKLFTKLTNLNQQRKKIAKNVLDEALQKAFIYENALIAKSGDWHEGVLGIVAAQMAEKFKRPAFIFSNTQHGIKGSARSFGNIDLMRILLQAKEILEEFGGHSKAAGVGIKEENFARFCQYLESLDSRDFKITQDCEAQDSTIINSMAQDCKVQDSKTAPESCANYQNPEILGEIDSRDIDMELFCLLDEFEPYGQGNPKPAFETTLQVTQIEFIKSKHQKFRFYETPIEGIFFFCDAEIKPNQRVKISFSLQLDSFSTKPVMIIREITESRIQNKTNLESS